MQILRTDNFIQKTNFTGKQSLVSKPVQSVRTLSAKSGQNKEKLLSELKYSLGAFLATIATISGIVTCGLKYACKNINKDIELHLVNVASSNDSEGGKLVTDDEKTYISEALQYFDGKTAGKNKNKSLLQYAYYTQYFTENNSDEGLKLTDKEKETIENIVEKKKFSE